MSAYGDERISDWGEIDEARSLMLRPNCKNVEWAVSERDLALRCGEELSVLGHELSEAMGCPNLSVRGCDACLAEMVKDLVGGVECELDGFVFENLEIVKRG